MNATDRHRYRITFAKTPHIRFISHLDLYHAWERTLRRASVPVLHSQGFNPRPKIDLGSALPLGYTSEYDIADLWLGEEMPDEELLHSLQSAAPPGLQLIEVSKVSEKLPSLQSQTIAAEYEVLFNEPVEFEVLNQKVRSLLDAETLPRERRGKPYDLRPLVETLEVVCHKKTEPELTMRLTAAEGATGRPDEVVLALGFEPTQTLINRKCLYLKSA